MRRIQNRTSRGCGWGSWLPVVLLLTWPLFSLADSQPGEIVSVVTKADDRQHREESIELLNQVLQLIEWDIQFSIETQEITECDGKTIRIGKLEEWLKQQKERLHDPDNWVCEESAENSLGCIADPGGRKARSYLPRLWRDRDLGELPALMVMDYAGRDTYFYSRFGAARKGKTWVASSPDCPEGCDDKIKKEQRPMYKASRILTLQYLFTELDDSSYIVGHIINQEITGIDDEALPLKGKIHDETRHIKCGTWN